MKKELCIGLLLASLGLAGCQKNAEPSASATPAPVGASATPAPVATASATPQAQGGLPFTFPAHQPDVEPGQFAFVPMASSVERLLDGSQKKVNDIRPREVVKAGPETSTIKDRKEYEVPNALVIPIPKSASAKNGDVIVGSPQYSSWEVAIVTDAADPSKPVVHLFKPVFGDAKPEGPNFLSQYESGRFLVLDHDLAPGSHALYPDGDKKSYGFVLKEEQDTVILEKFGGELAVFKTSEVTPIPIKPSLKKDDKVQAPFAKGMDPATVTKVDEKLGRVWVTFDGRENQGEQCFCFGQILPGSP